MATLEMTRSKGLKDGSPRPPRDRVLWILSNRGGKMERSTIRRRVDMRLADLEQSEGWIVLDDGSKFRPHNSSISLLRVCLDGAGSRTRAGPI